MSKANTLEGGTNGTVMTTANTTSGGNAASVVVSNNVSASGALAYSSAAAAYGSMGGRITPQAATSYWRWDETAGAATQRWVITRTFVHKAAPTATIPICAIYASGVLLGVVNCMSGSFLRLWATADISASDSPSLVVGTKYFVCLAVTPGTTISNGRIEYRLWRVSDGVQLHSYDSTANKNLGIVAINRCRIGGISTGMGWAEDDFDQLEFKQLASGFINPPASANNYVININDSATVTDTGLPQEIDFEWAQADATVVSDSPRQSRTLPQAEALSATDSTLPTRTPGLSDLVGITDNAIVEWPEQEIYVDWPRQLELLVGSI